MKLLIVSDAWHPQINGVVRTYEHLSEELRNLGHEVRVIGPADFPVTMPLPGYSEIKLAVAPYRRLKQLIEEHKPNSIHISVEGPLGWAARRYCLENQMPYTTTYHTQFPHYVAKRLCKFMPWFYEGVHDLGKKYVKTFHVHSKAMMVATQSLEDELLSWGFETPIHRVTRGANLDLFYPGKKTLFHDLPGPIALYVGRIAIEKNIEDFLSMSWEGSKVLVGTGPSTKELSQKYPDAHFVGKKIGEALAEHYRSSDLFVFPSRTDTFGMVIVEALACGVPVAAYDVIGPKDIITEPFLGSLHQHDLNIAAKNALDSGSPEERVQHVKNYFTWEEAGRQFEAGLLKK